MVVGGPLVVVVAGIVTAVIAVKGADPVLDKEAFERDLKAATANLDGQAKTEALIKLTPAHQARNHAASPFVDDEFERERQGRGRCRSARRRRQVAIARAVRGARRDRGQGDQRGSGSPCRSCQRPHDISPRAARSALRVRRSQRR